jgi:hypothetical protein
MNPLRAAAILACVLALRLEAKAAKPSDCDDAKHCQDNRLAADVIGLVRDPSNLAALYAIFDDKQHPFYEHRRAA